MHAAQAMLPPLGPGVEAEDVVTIEYWPGMLKNNDQWHQPAFDAAITNAQHIGTQCYKARVGSVLQMLRIVAASAAADVTVPKQAVIIFSDEAYTALRPTLNKLCVRSDAHTRVWVLNAANIAVNWCPYHCSAGRPPPHAQASCGSVRWRTARAPEHVRRRAALKSGDAEIKAALDLDLSITRALQAAAEQVRDGCCWYHIGSNVACRTSLTSP